MPRDLQSKQIRTARIIASGGIGHVGMMIYSASSATNFTGGIESAMTGTVGDDVFLFVSGTATLGTEGHQRWKRQNAAVTLFGGDVVISGSLYAERTIMTVNESKVGDFFVSGGLVDIKSNTDSANCIKLHADAGTSQTIQIINDAGTTDGSEGAGAIDIEATVGGISVHAADDKDIIIEAGQVALTANHDTADAIKLHADAGSSQTITLVNDAGTSVTEGSAAVQLLSSAGGIGIKSTANLANAILLTTDGGTSETIRIHSDQGVSGGTASSAAIELLADAGGINLTSSRNNTNAILLTADGGSSNTIKIHNDNSTVDADDSGTGAGSIQLYSDQGGVLVRAGLGKDVIAHGSQIFLNADGGIEKSIYLHADAGVNETIQIHSDQGTGVNAKAGSTDASINLVSDVGGIGLYSGINADNAITLEANGGVNETIQIRSNQGTGVATANIANTVNASIALVSDAGGIGITSGLNAASAIRIEADAGTSETIVISSNQGTGVGSVTLSSDTGGITLDAGTDIVLDADGGDVFFKDGGTEFGKISRSSGVTVNDMVISASLPSKLIVLKTQTSAGSEDYARFGGDQVLFLTGASAATSAAGGVPAIGTDTNFFVSGSTSSRNTAVKGTSVFGGDIHISGSLSVSGTISGGVDGSGAATRLAYWSDSDTLTSDADLNFNGSNLGLTGSTADAGSALDIDRNYAGTAGNSTLTSNDGASGILIDYDVTGVVASGQYQKHKALWIKYDQSAPSHVGTIQAAGLSIEMTGSTSGIQTVDGISVTVNDPGSLAGDAARGILINAPAGWVDGTANGSHLRCISQADTSDYFDISVGVSGLTQLTTVDAGAAAAHLNLKPDGIVTILSGGAPLSPNESTYADTCFFVSGTRGSRGTSNKGTAVFGGDLTVSGVAYFEEGPAAGTITDGTVALYGKDSGAGVTKLYFKNESGEIEVGSGGSGTGSFNVPSPGEFVTTASVSIAGSGLGLNYTADSVGADTYFFVSGATGDHGRNSSVPSVSTFGGDVMISGSLHAGVYLTPQTISENVSVPNNYNAVLFGPTVTIAATLSIGTNSVLRILS